MRVLIDTNIILDWWLERKPFDKDAAYVLSAVESGQIQGYLCATSMTTMHYFAAKGSHISRGREAISLLLKIFEIAPVSRSVLSQALESGMVDFEDAVVCFAAQEAGADAIITRDKQGFRKSPVRVLNCSELLDILES